MTYDNTATVGIESARANLGDLVDNARLRGESTTLTRHGKAAARITPVAIPYGVGTRALDAERIRASVQTELASIPAATAGPRHEGWSPLSAHFTVAAERIWEIAPFRQLADEIGPGFDTDTDSMDDDLAADVVRAAAAAIGRARAQLDAATWPTPTTRATDAARQLVEIAGLQRFVAILTGYHTQQAEV